MIEANQEHVPSGKILSHTGQFSSLMKCIGEEYPKDTCPMIDSTIDDLKLEIDKLEDKIFECDKEYKELENELDYCDIGSNEYENLEYDMGKLKDEIDDSKEEIQKLTQYIDDGEQLRSACEAARADLKSMSDTIKESVQLYVAGEYIICEVNPCQVGVEYDMGKESLNTPHDPEGYYDHAMENHSEFFRLAGVLEKISSSKECIIEDLCGVADYHSIDEFIEWYLD